jgi:hypothetical protein
MRQTAARIQRKPRVAARLASRTVQAALERAARKMAAEVRQEQAQVIQPAGITGPAGRSSCRKLSLRGPALHTWNKTCSLAPDFRRAAFVLTGAHTTQPESRGSIRNCPAPMLLRLRCCAEMELAVRQSGRAQFQPISGAIPAALIPAATKDTLKLSRKLHPSSALA